MNFPLYAIFVKTAEELIRIRTKDQFVKGKRLSLFERRQAGYVQVL